MAAARPDRWRRSGPPLRTALALLLAAAASVALAQADLAAPVGDGPAPVAPEPKAAALPSPGQAAAAAAAALDLPQPALDEEPSGPASAEWLAHWAFQRGGASWYGLRFHKRRTASGERYDMAGYTAAHRTLPFGTRVCVHSLVNGREVLVRINDRGPHMPSRIIDVSFAAAESLGMVGSGIKEVVITIPAETGRVCGQGPVVPGNTP